MSDPFHITHKYILDNNIQYMYSGVRLNIRRGTGDYPNFDMLRIQRENSEFRKKILKASPSDEERFCIARAPAFRFVEKRNVDKIVDRLLTPTISRKLIAPIYKGEQIDCPRYSYSRSSSEGSSNSLDTVSTNSSSSSRSSKVLKLYGHEKRPKSEVDASVERLLNRQTIMSSFKRREKFRGYFPKWNYNIPEANAITVAN